MSLLHTIALAAAATQQQYISNSGAAATQQKQQLHSYSAQLQHNGNQQQQRRCYNPLSAALVPDACTSATRPGQGSRFARGHGLLASQPCCSFTVSDQGLVLQYLRCFSKTDQIQTTMQVLSGLQFLLFNFVSVTP